MHETPRTPLVQTFRHRWTIVWMIGLAWALTSCVATSPSTDVEPGTEASSPITIRWTTASELDNYGFHVYRGLDAEGPFERLTEQIIPGAGTTDLPQHYVYEDLTAVAGRTYHYWVEAVSLSGTRRQLTPIQAVEAPR